MTPRIFTDFNPRKLFTVLNLKFSAVQNTQRAFNPHGNHIQQVVEDRQAHPSSIYIGQLAPTVFPNLKSKKLPVEDLRPPKPFKIYEERPMTINRRAHLSHIDNEGEQSGTDKSLLRQSVLQNVANAECYTNNAVISINGETLKTDGLIGCLVLCGVFPEQEIMIMSHTGPQNSHNNIDAIRHLADSRDLMGAQGGIFIFSMHDMPEGNRYLYKGKHLPYRQLVESVKRDLQSIFFRSKVTQGNYRYASLDKTEQREFGHVTINMKDRRCESNCESFTF